MTLIRPYKAMALMRPYIALEALLFVFKRSLRPSTALRTLRTARSTYSGQASILGRPLSDRSPYQLIKARSSNPHFLESSSQEGVPGSQGKNQERQEDPETIQHLSGVPSRSFTSPWSSWPSKTRPRRPNKAKKAFKDSPSLFLGSLISLKGTIHSPR